MKKILHSSLVLALLLLLTVTASSYDNSLCLMNGDVNSDGKITASDARTILRLSAKLETADDAVMLKADVDSSGKVTASDARTVLRVSAKLELPLSHRLIYSSTTKEPTCEESGFAQHAECILCGYSADSGFVIPPTGHTEIIDPGYPATAEKEGLTDGSHCAVCGKVLKEQTVIKKLVVPTYKMGFSSEEFGFPFETTYNSEPAQSDKILSGQLVVYNSIEPMPFKSFDSLDFNAAWSSSPNTFQLYLQALTPAAYLTQAYRATGEQKYLTAAENYIIAWNKYRLSPAAKNNNFVWYDHGCALRAEHLINYFITANEANLLSESMRDTLISLLKEHAIYLYNDDHYTKNHNHGIFQDRALILISYFLDVPESKVWLSHAEKRLMEQRDFAMNAEMVHVENSVGYHRGITKQFFIISEFLKRMNDPLGDTLYSEISKATEFLAYITDPNGTPANIGDTARQKDFDSVNTDSFCAELKNPHLTYAATQGKQGEKPESNSMFFPISGYYAGRSTWDNENYNQATWTVFKSGYTTATHKHADDNSFMLFSKGCMMLTDSGYYNYVYGDEKRDYVISSSAHNTVVPDSMSYSTTAERGYLTGFYDWKHTDSYDYVLGVNDSYNGISFDRHFYYLKNAVILYDDLQSGDNHTYSQLFHLTNLMKPVSVTDSEALYAISDTGYYLRIRQLTGNTDSEIRNDPNSFGMVSYNLNKTTPASTLVFNKRGANVQFVTLITIEDANGITEGIDNIRFDSSSGTFYIDSENGSFDIKLSQRKRVDAGDVSAKQTDSRTIVFKSRCNGDYLYAWEIYDKNSGKIIKTRTEYSASNSFTYTFPAGGEYLVTAYIKDKGITHKSICAYIAYNRYAGACENRTGRYDSLNLVYKGQSYSRVSGSTYRFSADYDFPFNSNVRWYIYKNGGYYDSVSGSDTLTYTFTSPGKYTVMYYITTQYSDKLFYYFKSVDI